MIAWALVPLNPKELTPAILGRLERGHGVRVRGISAGIESSEM